MRKSSTYNDPLISGGRQVAILFILIMSSITDTTLRYNYFLLFWIGECILYSCLESPVSKEVFNKDGEFTL